MRASHQLGRATCGNEPVALGADAAAGPASRKPGTLSRECASEVSRTRPDETGGHTGPAGHRVSATEKPLGVTFGGFESETVALSRFGASTGPRDWAEGKANAAGGSDLGLKLLAREGVTAGERPGTLSAAIGRPPAPAQVHTRDGLAGAFGLRSLSVVLALLAALPLAACDARPIESARTGNPDVEAALIARIENCNLYRVRDGANRSVYVAICPEGATRSSWSEGCGKGCTRDAGSLVVRARQGRD